MAAMGSRAGRRRHVNVLQHIAGYLERRVNAANRREVHDSIHEYRLGWLPRSVPLVLLRHHAREQGIGYLTEQTYFEPFPPRLLLNNDALTMRHCGTATRVENKRTRLESSRISSALTQEG